MQFTKAVRQKARLRLALSGPSGSGKTWGALTLAKGLGGKIAVIDTERGSASLYEHLADFDVLNLDAPFTPERYIAAIKAAEAGDYNVLIIDSITHVSIHAPVKGATYRNRTDELDRVFQSTRP